MGLWPQSVISSVHLQEGNELLHLTTNLQNSHIPQDYKHRKGSFAAQMANIYVKALRSQIPHSNA